MALDEASDMCPQPVGLVVDGHDAVRLDGHVGNVLCVAFTPEGASLLSGGDDGTVRVWSIEE